MEFEERYFREELDYLRQLSKLLATEKPHLARFLAEKDADPDIERLLEGVAFLTGNLRQKIEDEFPELTHGLIKMLWPNYLRPVPAMTLIEYTPDMDKSSVPVLIPRNEQFTTNAGEIRVDEVLPSDAKKEEPPPCTFTLCRDIWLLPVRLEQIENRSTTRNGVINITFSVAPGTDFRTLDLNKLRFWLGNDDNYTRDQLYLWFCEYLQGADLTVGEQHIRLPEFMLKAVGLSRRMPCCPGRKTSTAATGSFRSISVTPMRFSFLIFVVVRLCLTDCRRNSLPCNCVFRALCPWTSGCAAIPCACIAHLPLIYLSTMQKPSRWTTGGQTIRWFPAAITHNITMYFPLTVW